MKFLKNLVKRIGQTGLVMDLIAPFLYGKMLNRFLTFRLSRNLYSIYKVNPTFHKLDRGIKINIGRLEVASIEEYNGSEFYGDFISVPTGILNNDTKRAIELIKRWREDIKDNNDGLFISVVERFFPTTYGDDGSMMVCHAFNYDHSYN